MSGTEEADSVEGSGFEFFVPDGFLVNVVEESVEDSLLRVLREAQIGKGEMLAEEAERVQIAAQTRQSSFHAWLTVLEFCYTEKGIMC